MTPESSYGYAVIDFSYAIKRPLLLWQQFLVIHGCELLPDGRPRFRELLILVARQNGKTELLVILTLFWMFIDEYPLILGTSSKLEYAKESWEKVRKRIDFTPRLKQEMPSERKAYRRTNGDFTMTKFILDPETEEIIGDSRYKIAAANADAGRSLTINRIIMDEVRQQYDWIAYNAAKFTQQAISDAQMWMISNQGDWRSVVIHSRRKAALEFNKSGTGDRRKGIFEWSAPEGSDPEDLIALAHANPNLGRRTDDGVELIDYETVLGQALTAKANGGEELAGFIIEVLCLEVNQLDAAINAQKWRDCEGEVDLKALRDRMAWCFDISPDNQHVTLMAAARRDDGKTELDPIKSWSGAGCIAAFKADLPRLVAARRPRALGWFPGGPAATVAAEMAARKRRANDNPWPPRFTKIEEITGETTSVCMGFAQMVEDGEIVQSGDEMVTQHVTMADKLVQGERWRFTRLRAGHCDGAYAAAGAAALAQSVTPRRSLGVVSAEDGADLG